MFCASAFIATVTHNKKAAGINRRKWRHKRSACHVLYSSIALRAALCRLALPVRPINDILRLTCGIQSALLGNKIASFMCRYERSRRLQIRLCALYYAVSMITKWEMASFFDWL